MIHIRVIGVIFKLLISGKQYSHSEDKTNIECMYALCKSC